MTATDLGPWPAATAGDGDFTVQPPHDLAAEEQLLATLMRHPAAVDAAIDAGWHPDDMYREFHKVMAWAIAALADVAVIKMDHDGHSYGQLIDPVAITNHIGPGHPWFTSGVGTALLGKLATWPAVTPYPAEAARTIHSLAVKRRLGEAGIRICQYSKMADWDAARAVALAEAELGKVGGGNASVAAELEDPRVLAADHAATDYDWIVPGLLALMDRLILVGWEGHGKTRLLWQIAMCIASGVNPFRTELRIDPQRVLVIDLEVGRGIRARGFRGLLEHADAAGLDSSLIRIWSRPAGLDLRTPEGQADLSAAVRAHRPRLIVGGPMYKMGLAEADGPGDFKAVSDALDRVRERHQCALVLEQHAPMAQAGKPRLLRPMGSVLWTQWPEFGKGLRPVPDEPHTYDLPNFREDRETGRDWPTRLSWRRGYGWPWEASYDNPPPEPMTYRARRTDPAVQADLARQDHQDELAAQRAAHDGG
jgi:hypothetical protein